VITLVTLSTGGKGATVKQALLVTVAPALGMSVATLLVPPGLTEGAEVGQEPLPMLEVAAVVTVNGKLTE
jgi:hypothetical protein